MKYLIGVKIIFVVFIWNFITQVIKFLKTCNKCNKYKEIIYNKIIILYVCTIFTLLQCS